MSGNDGFTKLLLHGDGTNGSSLIVDSSLINKDTILKINKKINNDLCYVDDFVDYLIRYNKLNNFDHFIEPFNIEIDRSKYKAQEIKSREYEYTFDPPLKHKMTKTPKDPTYF